MERRWAAVAAANKKRLAADRAKRRRDLLESLRRSGSARSLAREATEASQRRKDVAREVDQVAMAAMHRMLKDEPVIGKKKRRTVGGARPSETVAREVPALLSPSRGRRRESSDAAKLVIVSSIEVSAQARPLERSTRSTKTRWSSRR